MSTTNSPLQFSIGYDHTVVLDLGKQETAFSINITNTTKDSLLYKMKLSNFELLSVSPFQGIIETNGKLKITVLLKKGVKEINFLDPKSSHSRFLFEYALYKSKMGNFETAWKALRAVPENPALKSHRFLCKVQPPPHTPLNYSEFLEQKVASQQLKLESIAWLLAEQVEYIRQLEDENSLLKRKVQRLELGEYEKPLDQGTARRERLLKKLTEPLQQPTTTTPPPNSSSLISSMSSFALQQQFQQQQLEQLQQQMNNWNPNNRNNDHDDSTPVSPPSQHQPQSTTTPLFKPIVGNTKTTTTTTTTTKKSSQSFSSLASISPSKQSNQQFDVNDFSNSDDDESETPDPDSFVPPL